MGPAQMWGLGGNQSLARDPQPSPARFFGPSRTLRCPGRLGSQVEQTREKSCLHPESVNRPTLSALTDFFHILGLF